jgi:hypothetical protein
MAQVTNTYDTFDSARNRETLSDRIDMIDPEETPLYSLLKKEKVEGVHPEWNLDSLATPVVTNAEVQGFVYDFDAITATSRVGNYTQIFSKSFIVAETQEAVAKAGPKSDYNREKLKKGVELRTDIEVTIAYNQASSAGSSAAAARLGGLRAWLATNDSMGTNGASGGFNSSTNVVDVATNGDQRAMTKALIDDLIEDVYTGGGNPKLLMFSPYLKRIFTSVLMNVSGTSTQQTNVKSGQARIIGAVDEYQSDFGLISVVPNRQWARAGASLARNAFLVDTEKVAYGTLRPIQEDKDVAKTSDAMPGILKHEGCLIVTNEKAHGVIADLYGMTAST